MNFADHFRVKLGDTKVVGRRLTVKEIKAGCGDLASGTFTVEKAIEIIRGHCTLEDGSQFDPEELSQDQIRTLVSEMVLPKEGRGIADFIGLLSPVG